MSLENFEKGTRINIFIRDNPLSSIPSQTLYEGPVGGNTEYGFIRQSRLDPSIIESIRSSKGETEIQDGLDKTLTAVLNPFFTDIHHYKKGEENYNFAKQQLERAGLWIE